MLWLLHKRKQATQISISNHVCLSCSIVLNYFLFLIKNYFCAFLYQLYFVMTYYCSHQNRDRNGIGIGFVIFLDRYRDRSISLQIPFPFKTRFVFLLLNKALETKCSSRFALKIYNYCFSSGGGCLYSLFVLRSTGAPQTQEGY